MAARTPTAAIHFHPEAYTTQQAKLMGRHAAGEGFLRGWLQHGQQPTWWALVEQAAHGQPFAQAVQAAGRREPVQLIDRRQLPRLAEPGHLHLAGPDLAEAAWQRAALGHAAWSLSGVTHTTASARVMDSLSQFYTAPVQPWDALICTSQAVRSTVEQVLQAQAEHLRQRLGAQHFVQPLLPVIPLGVHTGDFEHTEAERAQARHALGLSAQDVAVLFMGRLSFHAKAHPLAMYQALQAAQRQWQAQPEGSAQAGRLVLIECGWHANEAISQAYDEARRLAAPDLVHRLVDGRDGAARRQVWAAADVFMSLSDNVQETFGLTPIEAMAAGLPVVVSDWDGYRDTVRDGVDGFRVPTCMPAAGQGQDLALRHALGIDTYDQYCGLTCALVAIDTEATTRAFLALASDPARRRRLGEAGRARARAEFDWSVVIGRYGQLWAEQAELRRAAAPTQAAPGLRAWPARMDPWHVFDRYPSQTLQPRTAMALAWPDAASAWAHWQSVLALKMVDYARDVLPSADEVRAILQAAEVAGPAVWGPEGGPPGHAPAAWLVQGVAPARRAQAFRGLLSLAKWGVLRVAPPGRPTFHEVDPEAGTG